MELQLKIMYSACKLVEMYVHISYSGWQHQKSFFIFVFNALKSCLMMRPIQNINDIMHWNIIWPNKFIHYSIICLIGQWFNSVGIRHGVVRGCFIHVSLVIKEKYIMKWNSFPAPLVQHLIGLIQADKIRKHRGCCITAENNTKQEN